MGTTDTAVEEKIEIGRYYWCKSPASSDSESRDCIIKISSFLKGCAFGVCLDETRFSAGSFANFEHIDFEHDVTEADFESRFKAAREQLEQTFEGLRASLEGQISNFLPLSKETLVS